MISVSDIPFAGDSYSLTCTVTKADRLNPTITYQWFKNNTMVSGETQSNLFFHSLSMSHVGSYRCDVTITSSLLRQPILAMSNTQQLNIKGIMYVISVHSTTIAIPVPVIWFMKQDLH